MNFSVITVSYNSEDTIERTIRSVLNQKVSNYEYIIIDGGSTDNTVDIIKNYQKKFDGRLIWISEPDSGIYNAMNKGLMLAKNQVIGIVNSDDWLEPNVLELIDHSIKENSIDKLIICGWMNFHYTSGKIQLLKTNRKRLEKYIKHYRMGINHPATFVHRSVYDYIGKFDESLKINADLDFIIRCYKNDINFVFIDDVLSNMSDGGVSNKYSSTRLTERKKLLRKHTSNVFEYYVFLWQSILLLYLNRFSPYWLLRIYRDIIR